jgi:hypothetical protein
LSDKSAFNFSDNAGGRFGVSPVDIAGDIWHGMRRMKELQVASYPDASPVVDASQAVFRKFGLSPAAAYAQRQALFGETQSAPLATALKQPLEVVRTT